MTVSLIPFIWLPFFFVLFPNDAHLFASLTAACPSSNATPVCQAHTGLHLPGLSFLIPADFFFMVVELLQLRKLFCPSLHANSVPELISHQR